MRANKGLTETCMFLDMNGSYDEALAEMLTSNFTILMAGFSLIIFYFSFAMGKFNWVEQRVRITDFFPCLIILYVNVIGRQEQRCTVKILKRKFPLKIVSFLHFNVS